MKILVCISQVPDTTTRISFNGNAFNATGVQFIINPYDEIALTRAIELKETLGGSVTAITVGKADTEANLRKALAIGADDAIRVNTDANDAYFVAAQIADVAKKNGYELVLLGKESIDYNGSQVGSMIAAMMDVPFIGMSTRLAIEGNNASLDREIDGGKEVLATALPLVASAQKGMAEPRIPNMRGIMSARTKPLQVLEPAAADNLTAVISYEMPPAKAACKMVPADNPAQLIELLHNEAKVI